MRKTIFAFVLCLFASTSFAQEKEENKPERYYAGIGASFYQVTEDIKGFGGRRNGQPIWFNNEGGKFNGVIIVSRVMENSPAARAGLEEGDIVLCVDSGNGCTFNNVQDIVEKITNNLVGNSVHFETFKTDENGIAFQSYNLTIILEKIDRAAWVPKDVWFTSSMSSCRTQEVNRWNKVLKFVTVGLVDRDKCSYNIQFATMVSEDGKAGKFTYKYRITNTRGKTVVVRSEAVDIASGSMSSLVELKRGKVKEFVLVTEEWPIEASVLLYFHEKPEKWLIDYERKKGLYSPSNGYWAGSATSGATAFVPAYYLQRYRERNKDWFDEK